MKTANPKVFNTLKTTTTPNEAAIKLTNHFNETVSEADVLQLGLEGKLKLSVNLRRPILVRSGRFVKWEETQWAIDFIPPRTYELEPELTSGNPKCPPALQEQWECVADDLHYKYYPIMTSLNVAKDRFVNFDIELSEICGIMDLPMLGGERNEVQRRMDKLRGDKPLSSTGNDSCYLENETGDYFCIQNNGNGAKGFDLSSEQIDEEIHDPRKMSYFKYRLDFNNSSELPTESQLVIRTAELIRFLKEIERDVPQKETIAYSREEQLYLLIFKGLLKANKINITKQGSNTTIYHIVYKHEQRISLTNIADKIEALEMSVNTGLFASLNFENVTPQNTDQQSPNFEKKQIHNDAKTESAHQIQLHPKSRRTYRILISSLYQQAFGKKWEFVTAARQIFQLEEFCNVKTSSAELQGLLNFQIEKDESRKAPKSFKSQ